MTQTKMPEPVAWMLAYQTMGGDVGWKLSWTQSGAGVCYRLSGESHEKPLITTTQAEAYADARVREVLRSLLRDMNGHVRAAHSRFGETGKPYDEGRRIAYEQAAADIRALIPPLPGPVEPQTN